VAYAISSGRAARETPSPPAARGERSSPSAASSAARSSARDAIVIAALAIALRVAWVLLVPTRPVGDFALYMESAAHLLEHGALDDEFIYMPGYVFLLAAVQALGGGLLACKMIGAASGGLGAWAVHRITARLASGFADGGHSRAAAAVAGLLCALWPAGIAVASVTGTDMPAAALLGAAVAVLVRPAAAEHRWRAAVGFGALLGLAAYVRAVALPLALLALPFWLATGTRLRTALARTALGCVVAFLLLLPWGLRNRARYCEFFVTDSHGGHTALVGANPNSEGTYSRSLNQMFWKGTGYRLFDPKPRDSDRAAYALARSWAAFEPAYAAGLVAVKADRLLTHERGLLYWPLYRESVLGDPPRRWFDGQRAHIERIVDGYWYFLAAAALAGLGVAVCRRDGRALSLALFPAALVALYATFFSEVRYHLAIAIFMFPYAALALRWLAAAPRGGARKVELAAVAAIVAALFVGWPRLLQAAAGVRARHRWAVCVCDVAGQSRLCNFRARVPGPERRRDGPSPLRGVWDGIGLYIEGAEAAAETRLDLPPGRYRVSLRGEAGDGEGKSAGGQGEIDDGALGPSLRATLRAGGAVLAEGPVGGREAVVLAGDFNHPGGEAAIDLRVSSFAGAGAPSVARAWFSDIRVEPDLR